MSLVGSLSSIPHPLDAAAAQTQRGGDSEPTRLSGVDWTTAASDWEKRGAEVGVATDEVQDARAVATQHMGDARLLDAFMSAHRAWARRFAPWLLEEWNS